MTDVIIYFYNMFWLHIMIFRIPANAPDLLRNHCLNSCFLFFSFQFIYQRFYKSTSAADPRTLYQLWNVIGRLDVKGPDEVVSSLRRRVCRNIRSIRKDQSIESDSDQTALEVTVGSMSTLLATPSASF